MCSVRERQFPCNENLSITARNKRGSWYVRFGRDLIIDSGTHLVVSRVVAGVLSCHYNILIAFPHVRQEGVRWKF